MRDERGVATVEWTALVLVVSLALGAMLTVGPRIDGRAYGAFLAHSILCAARGGCDDGDDELTSAYGAGDAALVRRYAPNLVYEPGTFSLPVDWRECRSRRCSDAPDDPDLDAHRSARSGHRATAFTRVVREGGETFIQYWLYYPQSRTTVAHLSGAFEKAVSPLRVIGIEPPRPPGAHPDDWESYQVRLGADGRTTVRASSHDGYQGCKQRRCRDRWTPWTGWTRVSWGSHAGHIPLRSERVDTRVDRRPPFVHSDYRYTPQYPGRDLRERTSTGPGLRLVPLESVNRGAYRPLPGSGITPPWEKEVYDHPRSDSTG